MFSPLVEIALMLMDLTIGKRLIYTIIDRSEPEQALVESQNYYK